MDCCSLSSTGLNDIDANNITSDNISVISSLKVSRTNVLSSITDILSSINHQLIRQILLLVLHHQV